MQLRPVSLILFFQDALLFCAAPGDAHPGNLMYIITERK
jgi:hypothetical protein